MSSKKPSDHGIFDRDAAYVLHPVLPLKTGEARPSLRRVEDVLKELEGLARAIELDVVQSEIVKLSKITPGSFFTKGLRENIAENVKRLEPSVVIVNAELSPVQQRNLEKSWDTKVIDRTGLILEIFGERARTKEGRIQVELAALEYQRSRLVRSWTHLERQRGGAGFMGGPGERQIELDRRIIGQKITKLKKELEQVKRTRDLGRKSRERVPFPIVALVGYTNAGKSTLFNTLTKANVFAEDLLFATLDPTMRRLKLPGRGQEVILADTVGFISDLPTHLVVSFRATLEQITYADVILHVIDVSREDYESQRYDVIRILADLKIDYEQDPRILEIFNKIDLLEKDTLSDFERQAKVKNNICLISAEKGQGLENLLERITGTLSAAQENRVFTLRPEDGKALAWLYEHGRVIERSDDEKAIRICVTLTPENTQKFAEHYGYEAA